MKDKKEYCLSELSALGFKRLTSDGLVEQYYNESNDHLVTIEPVIVNGAEQWLMFSETGKTFLDELGMEHHERVGLSMSEAHFFTLRAAVLASSGREPEATEENA